MLVAMEKYRQKHMESLHEGYKYFFNFKRKYLFFLISSRRMSTFRENYHNQVETIRNSYLESSERFRDYRQAQKENVQQHLDGYYQQVFSNCNLETGSKISCLAIFSSIYNF